MSGRVFFTVLIYLHQDKKAVFQEYERKSAPLITRYNGRFEQVITPTNIVGELEQPDEIHVLSFANETDFASYRQDPESVALAPLREESVQKAIFIQGYSSYHTLFPSEYELSGNT